MIGDDLKEASLRRARIAAMDDLRKKATPEIHLEKVDHARN